MVIMIVFSPFFLDGNLILEYWLVAKMSYSNKIILELVLNHNT